MKTVALLSVCLCGLWPVVSLAQDATAAGGGVKCTHISPPVIPASAEVYTRSDSDLSDAGEYPAAARLGSIEGQAVVDCQIGADGYLTQCFVEQESRSGYDFGQALAITVLKWAQTETETDGHHAGDWLRFSANWKMPPMALADRQR